MPEPNFQPRAFPVSPQHHAFAIPEVYKKTKVLGVISDSVLLRECIVSSMAGSSPEWKFAAISSLRDLGCPGDDADIVILICSHLDKLRDYLEEQGTTLSEIAQRYPAIVIGNDKDPARIRELLRLGARGYARTQSTGISLLMGIVRLVAAGGIFVPPECALARTPEAPPQGATTPGESAFTAREKEILGKLKEGKPNKIIAHELELSESTVKSHIQRVMRKLNVVNRTEIVCRTLRI